MRGKIISEVERKADREGRGGRVFFSCGIRGGGRGRDLWLGCGGSFLTTESKPRGTEDRSEWGTMASREGARDGCQEAQLSVAV